MTRIFCSEVFDEGIVYEKNHNFTKEKREQHTEKDITGLIEIQSKVIKVYNSI